MKRKFIGFTVVNVKTGNYVDYDGSEYKDGFSTWPSVKGAKEIIDEIVWYTQNYNNKYSRKLKKLLKNFKVVKVYNTFENA